MILSVQELHLKLRTIRLLALDVDGVLTDDTILVGPNGAEFKRFNISDGFFIQLAMRAGLEIAIVSGRASEATTSRMKELGVRHLLQGNRNKVAAITPLLESLTIDRSDVAFVGNELLDIPLARVVGLPVAVADSAAGLLAVAKFVTTRNGGDGAVRELLEHWFIAKGIQPESFI